MGFNVGFGCFGWFLTFGFLTLVITGCGFLRYDVGFALLWVCFLCWFAVYAVVGFRFGGGI